MVVSTTNTSHLLKDMGHIPDSVLVNHSTSATEVDVYVPLSLKQQFVILAGDKKLKPVVHPLGFDDFVRQM